MFKWHDPPKPKNSGNCHQWHDYMYNYNCDTYNFTRSSFEFSILEDGRIAVFRFTMASLCFTNSFNVLNILSSLNLLNSVIQIPINKNWKYWFDHNYHIGSGQRRDMSTSLACNTWWSENYVKEIVFMKKYLAHAYTKLIRFLKKKRWSGYDKCWLPAGGVNKYTEALTLNVDYDAQRRSA